MNTHVNGEDIYISRSQKASRLRRKYQLKVDDTQRQSMNRIQTDQTIPYFRLTRRIIAGNCKIKRNLRYVSTYITCRWPLDLDRRRSRTHPGTTGGERGSSHFPPHVRAGRWLEKKPADVEGVFVDQRIERWVFITTDVIRIGESAFQIQYQ